MADRGTPAPAELYRTIVADPPWPYKTPGQIGATLDHRPNRDLTLGAGNAGSRSRYGAMTMDQIKSLPIPAAVDAHLYLWATNAFIEQAHEVVRAWGFRPITVITWTKIKKDGSPSMKMGHYYRGATEHVVFGVRGSLRLTKGLAFSTALLAPRQPHSRKPDEFYELVTAASPGPYLDMFARTARPGWDAWGNEAPNAVTLAVSGG